MSSPSASQSAPARSPIATPRGGVPPGGQAFRVQLGRVIFLSRWLQMPLYFGLIVVQGIYVYRFLRELWHITSHVVSFTETEIMLAVLGLIDVVMIANLLVMVIVGGYETFVSRLYLEGHPDQPEWLSHVNAGVLKVKLAMALIGISSIHLLQTFISAGKPVTAHASASGANAPVAIVGAAGESLPNAAPAADHAAPAAAPVVPVALGVAVVAVPKAAISAPPEAVSAQSAMIQVGIHLTFLVSALALAWTDRLSTAGHGNGHQVSEGRPAAKGRRDDAVEDDPSAPRLSPGDSMM